jgi:hypothetical protein
MKIFFFHWLILFLCLMIVVLDIMLFGYDGMKRLVHAGECFKAFALTGRKAITLYSPGRCPELGASALSGRVA